jgi:O-antigen/teichoic acid export membrane protein
MENIDGLFNTEKNDERKSKTRQLLIVTTIIWGVLLLPSGFIALMSAMMFDAPGSEENGLLWFCFFSFLSFPLMCLFAFFGWIPYAYSNFKLAKLIALSPILSAIFVIVALFFLGAGGAF